MERQEVRDFLAEHIPGIDSNAVPETRLDAMYTPLVPVVRDAEGVVIAAALTCRSQVAAGASMLRASANEYATVLDKHSELDLLAVAPHARGRGLGTQIMNDLEGQLAQRGVRVWFGNVTHDQDAHRLRCFYSRLGFKVLDEGQRLPLLLGKEWMPPNLQPPAFFFYKQIRSLRQPSRW